MAMTTSIIIAPRAVADLGELRGVVGGQHLIGFI